MIRYVKTSLSPSSRYSLHVTGMEKNVDIIHSSELMSFWVCEHDLHRAESRMMNKNKKKTTRQSSQSSNSSVKNLHASVKNCMTILMRDDKL